MIDETLHLLEETVARNKQRMSQIQQTLTFAGEAASLFVDVHRMIDDDLKIMEDVSRMWAYAARRVQDILGSDDLALLRNEDVIGQAKIILRLNEVVIKDNAEKLGKNNERLQILHEALMRLAQAVSSATKEDRQGRSCQRDRKDPE